jgi:2-oxoglutarate dehydrogenase E2 component (dihydrolipoamide succinyltransferase)
LGIVKAVNSLAGAARSNKLKPDDISGATFTTTNFGSFDSLTGTPIINQPQVAILGIGAIRKKPVVLETPQGDVIAIRNIMILSLAYDHRVVDGALGGMYLKRVKELLENFDVNTSI